MQGLLYRIVTTSDATKKVSFSKKVLCALRYIFKKLDRGIVEKPDAVGAQYCPGKLLL